MRIRFVIVVVCGCFEIDPAPRGGIRMLLAATTTAALESLVVFRGLPDSFRDWTTIRCPGKWSGKDLPVLSQNGTAQHEDGQVDATGKGRGKAFAKQTLEVKTSLAIGQRA
jgi:hypothetical protein